MSSLKKYRKIKYLGKGSYGAAILVELRSNPSQKFAMKEIVVGHLKPHEQNNAKNEAEVLHQLSHSNITMYIESFVENSKLYIVMEYADGGDLAGAIKRQKQLGGKRWEEEDIMRIFVQICLALKHVHDANILHRDLKSMNVFLTTQGIVKLGDFGIAKVLDATDDQAQTQIGTPYYLSPEICESKPYGRAADIWSLGVILFELAALELPFVAQSLPMLIHQICSAEPRISITKIEEYYSADLVNMIRSLLQKDPDRRPTIKDILKTSFVKEHISKLLSYTIKAGNATGGLDGVAAAAVAEATGKGSDNADPDEIHQEADKVKWQQRELEIKREIAEINQKEAMEREQRRNEEKEKLRKFRSDMMKRKEDEQEAKSSAVARLDAKPQIQSLAEYQRSRGSPPVQSNMQVATSSRSSTDYDSFARQEYFANRAAAAAVKAKIEMNLGTSASSNAATAMNQQQPSNVATRVGGPIQQPIRRSSPTISEYDDPEQRIAAIKAQKEREKQQQLEEKQRQLEAAAAEYRQQRKLIEAKRASESNSQAKNNSAKESTTNRSPGVAFSISFDDEKPPVQLQADAKDHRKSPAPHDSASKAVSGLPPKQPSSDRVDDASIPNANPSPSNAARKGWSKPAPGENVIVSPLGVVSLTPTSETSAEDSNERAVLNRVASRNQNRVQARQQAKVILRRLRDEKQRENKAPISSSTSTTTTTSANSSSKTGVRKASPSESRLQSVLSSIQRATDSVEKAKASSRSSSSSRPPKAKPSTDNNGQSEEILEETLNKWLKINDDRYATGSNEIIDDITSVVVDDNLTSAMKATCIPKEVDEEEELIMHAVNDEVASLQCELAKALMNNDDI